MKHSKACYKCMRELVAEAYEKELSLELEAYRGIFNCGVRRKLLHGS